MSNFTEKTTFITCSCHTHILAVSRDPDLLGGDSVEISMWQCGAECSPHWKNQLRHIWRIITRGHPYVDSVILEKDEVEKLVKVLLSPN